MIATSTAAAAFREGVRDGHEDLARDVYACCNPYTVGTDQPSGWTKYEPAPGKRAEAEAYALGYGSAFDRD